MSNASANASPPAQVLKVSGTIPVIGQLVEHAGRYAIIETFCMESEFYEVKAGQQDRILAGIRYLSSSETALVRLGKWTIDYKDM